MKIKSLTIKNFRAIKDASLNSEAITILVGRNGAGKSSFLHALDVFYNPNANIREDDFFDHDNKVTIEIEVNYYDLRKDEILEFGKYIINKELIVKKKIAMDDGRVKQEYYGIAKQIPEFAEIRNKDGAKEKIKAYNDLVDGKRFEGLDKKAKSGVQVEQEMHEYESKNQDKLEPIEEKSQFFGAKTVGGGKLDKFTKFIFIHAVHEVTDETSGKKGVINQLLELIITKKINLREDVREFKNEFEKKMLSIYSSENLTELKDLGNSITNTLKRFSPGAELKLNWEQISLPSLSLPNTKVTLIEDSFECDIQYKGHGLQRALLITLFQELEKIMHIEQNIEGERNQSEPDIILALEEPELYLHPSRCRYLSNLFLDLVNEPKSESSGEIQIIYTTHSPYFVELSKFDQLRIIRKESKNGIDTPQSYVLSYSLAALKSELASFWERPPDEITEVSLKAHTQPVMNVITNEGFFADIVVIVEGLSDVGLLWSLQEILDKLWDEKGIVIVPAEGKSKMDKLILIFKGFSIPTYFIFDGDAQNKGKQKEQNTIELNKVLMKIAGVFPQDFPTTEIHDDWAVFNKKIEKELLLSIGDVKYCEFTRKLADELGYKKSKDVLKNIEGVSRLIKLIYNEGLKVPFLEDIIEKIDELSSK
ncbi:MAG: AAA family ATPase [Candidatus Hodarchaeota archaeon]